jgi:GNAT superfamily N-acetyltransferase
MCAFVPFDPALLTEAAFLAGPERFPAEWLVDPIFGKEFRHMVADVQRDEPDLLDSDGLGTTPSDVMAGYSFSGITGGLALIDPGGNWAGGYIGADVALDPAHRGLGLGAELILEYAMRSACLPTWDLDEAAYSPAGEAAHRAAWRLSSNREVFDRKSRRLRELFSGQSPSAMP